MSKKRICDFCGGEPVPSGIYNGEHSIYFDYEGRRLGITISINEFISNNFPIELDFCINDLKKIIMELPDDYKG